MSTVGRPGDAVTHPLAKLYSRWALNPIVDVARGVAHDVPVRPERYVALTEHMVEVLTDFRFKIGRDPAWPDLVQRTLSFKILFTANKASPPLREAALRYVESAAAGQTVILEAFNAAASDLRSQLSLFDGQPLAMSDRQTETIFGRATEVFQDPVVAAAFGVNPAPKSGWPLAVEPSATGSRTVGDIAAALRAIQCLGGAFRRQPNGLELPLVPTVSVALPPDKFEALQQAAYFGGRSLSSVLSADEELGHDAIMTAYRWTKALQRLLPDPVRAWKDLPYRAGLTDLEWGMVPHPAGDASAISVLSGGYQTNTVHGEVCCCSGDLDCDPTQVLSDFCSEYQCASVAEA